MDFPRHILRLMAILGTLLLASCIDGREEYWLNADGSGRVDIRYSLPATAARFQGGEEGVREKIMAFLARTPAIKSPVLEVSTLDGRMTIHLRGAFDAVLELKDIYRSGSLDELPSSATGLTGSISMSVAGRTASFSRTIDAGKALPGAFLMPASQFDDCRLTYVVHLPLAATGTNATRTSDGGRTLAWDFPLKDAVRFPLTIRFSAPAPIPVWLLVGGATAGLAFMILAGVGWRKLRGMDLRSILPQHDRK